MAKARRRSAAEWERFVREWERSGLTTAAFAAKLRVRKETLEWWRWRLGRGARATLRSTAVELVPVKLEPEPEETVRGEVAWEIAGPSGHVLRVYERDTAELLREALDVVAQGRRNR